MLKFSAEYADLMSGGGVKIQINTKRKNTKNYCKNENGFSGVNCQKVMKNMGGAIKIQIKIKIKNTRNYCKNEYKFSSVN